jgi:hypothetical protein
MSSSRRVYEAAIHAPEAPTEEYSSLENGLIMIGVKLALLANSALEIVTL